MNAGEVVGGSRRGNACYQGFSRMQHRLHFL